jgi:carbonic anhydrase
VSDLPALYERNARFVETFDKGSLPIDPALSLIVLTCVDARVDPAHFAGVELGDAFVLRNPGARVTDAVAREIATVWTLLDLVGDSPPALELAIIHHTKCGVGRFSDPEVAAEVTRRFGSSELIDAYAIGDHAETMAADIERLRDNPMVPRGLEVSGHMYDIVTGRLTEMVATQTLD